MEIQNLECHQKAQKIAKMTMRHLKGYIKEGMNEADIAKEAENFMRKKGAGFWYHMVGAVVLAGDRTMLSVSGKDYAPTDRKVSRIDLVTIDLSPEIKGCWGDYARSFAVTDGVVKDTAYSNNLAGLRKELAEGIDMENILHNWIMRKIKSGPEITFEGIYLGARQQADLLGYKILDFRGNVGHTIERELDDRVYIEEGCERRVSDTGLFAFEPHLGKNGYGFKREDIYYFSGGKLERL